MNKKSLNLFIFIVCLGLSSVSFVKGSLYTAYFNEGILTIDVEELGTENFLLTIHGNVSVNLDAAYPSSNACYIMISETPFGAALNESTGMSLAFVEGSYKYGSGIITYNVTANVTYYIAFTVSFVLEGGLDRVDIVYTCAGPWNSLVNYINETIVETVIVIEEIDLTKTLSDVLQWFADNIVYVITTVVGLLSILLTYLNKKYKLAS